MKNLRRILNNWFWLKICRLLSLERSKTSTWQWWNCSEINVNFHHFFLPLSNDYKQRFFYYLNMCHLEKELRSLLLEIIERKKWNCTWKDKILGPLFRVFNNWGLLRGFLWSLCQSFADTLLSSVWLGTNVTLELFLFLRKFVANCLSWDNSCFPW